MQDHDTRYGPQNWLVFRTQPGAVTIPAGETARLNENLEGFDIAEYYTIAFTPQVDKAVQFRLPFPL